MTRFSISSSAMFSRMRSSPPPNSSRSLIASTTLTMLSRRASPYWQNSGPIIGMEHIVCAIGIGSQMPDASMTI